MNKKVSILIVALVLAIVVFVVATNMQKELIDFVPTVKCLIANKDIPEYQKVSSEDFTLIDMPISAVSNVRVIQDYEEIKDLFLKSDIYKGQILLYNQFSSADELMIIKGEEGKEKISIKIKESENGTSYILKKGSTVNVYATLNSEYANSKIFENNEKASIGANDYGYTIIKILDNVKVLDSFDVNGEKTTDMPERNIDTILISVLPEEAQKINLIRDIATFNITEL